MPAPTGRVVGGTLMLTRHLPLPASEVWTALTEPARLERWIGTWTGDPAEGQVMFTMTAEGEHAPAEQMTISVCEPPLRLVLVSRVGDDWWDLELELGAAADGGTLLTFKQPGVDPAAAESVGPGWEYYLDRLVAAETGGDVSAIDFDRDYYPAMAAHYRRVG
ncbi:polyketide cyclase [Nocardioides sp. IC4_145]|uniref:SRPBCC domain-containing protein n=1 Tax=Nocardioides sp. IC4_145 TaxID=2714037 RepID=UPI0014086DF2|nr:SRPBCC domain-containing protein [Nocardioides sp. IC4_145]NHC22240.1 polyketide cyclase [Nocardioides sp. IC4_145]